jgi:hypothetical protein
MTFKQRVDALRQRTQSEAGFTIFELVSAITLASLVSIATVTILISVTTNVGQSQANTAMSAQTESVVTNFSRAIRGANTFESFSAQGVMFMTENGITCEKHQYQYVADDVTPGRLALRHVVTSVELPTGASCESVAEKLRSGSIDPLNDDIELRSLRPDSHFSIYASTGQELPTLGSSDYVSDGDLPNCKIAAVDIVLNNILTNAKGGSAVQQNYAHVALLNNVRGLTC